MTSARDSHPRPRLIRSRWVSLDGEWEFALDPGGDGLEGGWWRGDVSLEGRITVPFPPESPASGIGDLGPHRVLWYRRLLTSDDLAGAGERLVLHFGAVDYRASVWVEGQLVAEHEGGHTPFSADLSRCLPELAAGAAIVVRAEDDARDTAQPRGKQDWEDEAHVIWYSRTSGIWQPVWLERTPRTAIASVDLDSDLGAGTITAVVRLTRTPASTGELAIELRHDDVVLASGSVRADRDEIRMTLELPAMRNGQAYESLLWSPEHPRLIDAAVTLRADGAADAVLSYVGLRRIGWHGGRFLLNDRPHRVRAVLAQNYWPESHLAAPSAEALRREVELIRELGFTTARVHQKIEDPRFLYWADRLGLMVWAEAPSAYDFSPTAVARSTREWIEAVARDRSHPCVVAWVPLNESWGIQHIAHDERQRDFAEALYRLTKALDATRPVISNDGWEHATSDLLTLHDYTMDPERLAQSYATSAAIEAAVVGVGPAGRRVIAPGSSPVPGAPIIVSEFGGVTWAPGSAEGDGTWGYAVAHSTEEFERHLTALIQALDSSEHLAGWCYTQLTDTMQEANGLLDEQRRPKLPMETLRRIIAQER
ncbi:glycoside hydrolase family 2 protein [Microcella alkalica]|uniref:Beta-galactosidase/beta-glucuronidase n=1 Tax=Microcella alkalica TaxID=355930 RepID=A0A839E5I2_9MICO|nr:sugar-binding domain-containing protein [Microcella alkalica]MBA8846777.1 beta-galactosidase/beta-glucuronidase [Microcella alkalica]